MRLCYMKAAALALILSSFGRAESDLIAEKYRRFIVQNVDRRNWLEKAFNALGLSQWAVGRSYALIAGVTEYPNLPLTQQTLEAAKVDIENLQRYLRDQEFFDVIVVLKDGDMNYDNLQYFLTTYFPPLLKAPHSRFLFAYSGHGYVSPSGKTTYGYLLTSAATSLSDPVNRLPMDILHTLVQPVVDSANHVLVLLNACESGAFRGRSTQGPPLPFDPDGKDAYAIMSSRATEESLQIPEVGPGSVFFEEFFAALAGAADKNPADGIVTFHELNDYLHSEVRYVTKGQQNIVDGDISANGSNGEFYFLNRTRQIRLGNSPPWNAVNANRFGGQEAESQLDNGKKAYRESRYGEALKLFLAAATAGNSEAMFYLGLMYKSGQSVAVDKAEAHGWFQKAADSGETRAMIQLAFDANESWDYRQARQWQERAVDAGNATGTIALGAMHLVAAEAAKKGPRLVSDADAGDIDSKRLLLILRAMEPYEDAAQNYEQARKWFERGADAGFTPDMVMLGDLYAAGRGVPQDFTLARKWYEKAIAAGSSDARQRLQKLAK
jgi:hypothetical protein